MKRFLLVLLYAFIFIAFVGCNPSTGVPSFESNNPTNTTGNTNNDNDDIEKLPIQEETHDHVYLLKTILVPTCEAQGKQAYVCEICGKTQHETNIDALGHKFRYSEELSSQCTCTADGKRVDKCIRCVLTKEEIRPAHGHIWYPYSFCDSSTNEIVVKTDCMECETISVHEYRYFINDVTKLVGDYDCYADLDYTIVFDQNNYQQIQKAPFYRIYFTSTYMLIVRNTKSFEEFYPSNFNKSPKQFYINRGCTVLLEKNISINENGKIEFQN